MQDVKMKTQGAEPSPTDMAAIMALVMKIARPVLEASKDLKDLRITIQTGKSTVVLGG